MERHYHLDDGATLLKNYKDRPKISATLGLVRVF